MSKKCRVIITEDDHDDASFLKDALLEGAFHGEVIHLEDGEKLMHNLSTLHEDSLPEMIILDLNMRYKSGYDVLTEINQNPKLKNIPIAVVTASIRTEDQTYCEEQGCSLFVRKPVSVKEYFDIGNRIVSLIKAKYNYC